MGKIKPKYTKPVLVFTSYRTPDANTEYFHRFDEKVQSISHEDMVILGDFNLDCLYKDTLKVDEFCTNNQLTQLIDKPTQVTETFESLIDLICVSKPEKITKSEVLSCRRSRRILYCFSFFFFFFLLLYPARRAAQGFILLQFLLLLLSSSSSSFCQHRYFSYSLHGMTM